MQQIEGNNTDTVPSIEGQIAVHEIHETVCISPKAANTAACDGRTDSPQPAPETSLGNGYTDILSALNGISINFQ